MRQYNSPVRILVATLVALAAVLAFSSSLLTGTEPSPAANKATAGAVSDEMTSPAADSAAVNDRTKESAMAIATFGAGCFWGVEAAFRQIDGVTATSVGYAGGATVDPNYREVCTGTTGHAEVVRVEYDPEKVSYDQLLTVFWENHDPTTVNRQGPDIGEQYRSVIFYHTPEQELAAEQSKAKLDKSGTYRNPIVTQIEEAGPYYLAEDYHQQYLEKRGLSTCRIK